MSDMLAFWLKKKLDDFLINPGYGLITYPDDKICIISSKKYVSKLSSKWNNKKIDNNNW